MNLLDLRKILQRLLALLFCFSPYLKFFFLNFNLVPKLHPFPFLPSSVQTHKHSILYSPSPKKRGAKTRRNQDYFKKIGTRRLNLSWNFLEDFFSLKRKPNCKVKHSPFLINKNLTYLKFHYFPRWTNISPCLLFLICTFHLAQILIMGNISISISQLQAFLGSEICASWFQKHWLLLRQRQQIFKNEIFQALSP